MSKHTSLGLVVVLLARAVGTHAQVPSQGSRAATRTPTGCADLTGFTVDGNTSITSATLVTSGAVVVGANVTLTNLPPFCRVQGLSKPSTDSSIVFEVWLPQPANWNARFGSFGSGVITMAPTLEKFIRLETNGISWRRMSPPPSVRCCEMETAAIRPRFK